MRNSRTAEETGYRAAEWARAGVMHNAIAYSNEGIEIWFARGLTRGDRRSMRASSSTSPKRHAWCMLDEAAQAAS